MNFRPESLADGQLAASETSMYLCQPGTQVKVDFISLVNTDSSTRTCNLYVKRSGGTSRRIIPKDESMDADDCIYVLEPSYVIKLSPGDDIRGDASAATVIDYFISGEISVP